MLLHFGRDACPRRPNVKIVIADAWGQASLPAFFRNCSIVFLLPLIFATNVHSQTQEYPIESLALSGNAQNGEGALQFIARLLPPPVDKERQPVVYTLTMNSEIQVKADGITQKTTFDAAIKSGKLEELTLQINSTDEIKSVTGDEVKSWSQRRLLKPAKDAVNIDQLVITLNKPIEKGNISFVVSSSHSWEQLPITVSPVAFNMQDPRLLQGQIKVQHAKNVSVNDWRSPGLLSVKTLEASKDKKNEPRIFSTDGQAYSLQFTVKPPLSAPSRLTDFSLVGKWQESALEFKMKGKIVVDDPDGADLFLLSGAAAFTELPEVAKGEIVYRDNTYRFICKEAGSFPIEGTFVTRINKRPGNRWVEFGLAESMLRPVELIGMPVSANRVSLGGAPVEDKDSKYIGYLPPSGKFYLDWIDPAWQDSPTHQAKLFFTAESHIETTVGVGLLRQSQLIKVNILQGEMDTLNLWLEGEGEVTQISGPSVLSWKIEPQDSERRSIKIRFNRPQLKATEVSIDIQTALGEFPVTETPPRLTSDEAIRTGGYWSLRNSGAVELSTRELQNLAQIAPEFLPAHSSKEPAKQILAYRFAGDQYSLKLHADNILPEVAVSQILIYHIEENEQSITAEMECDIRRAPIRDFRITLPVGYSLADVQAPALADYFITGEDHGQPELRLVFNQPLEGKRVFRMRLERNELLSESSWKIPYLAPIGVKSIRGHLGIAATPGLRLSVKDIDGLSEQVTTYFPQRTKDLRLALRLRQPIWSGNLDIEKLNQSVQAESLHLVTLAEGALYGSTIINYAIGDAPVDSFRLRVPADYQNINFSGANLRSWKELENNEYLIDLQRALSGPYTLLVTFESKFSPQGAHLSFGNIEPLAVESEQGYVVVTSDFPFDISSIEQSPGLLLLEPNEIPAEFRLLYESQTLAAYQYTNRPFNLSLEVAPFSQGQTVNQVVDYTELDTQISGDGEMLTTATYQLKSKGHPHFRLTLPPDSTLWSVTVAGEKVTPAADNASILVPLPAGHEADTPITVRLEWASEATQPKQPQLEAPRLMTPALLVNWTVTTDPGYGLRYEGGTLQPNYTQYSVSAWTWFRDVLFGKSVFLKICVLAFTGSIIFGAVCLLCLRRSKGGKVLLRVGLLCSIIFAILAAGILFSSSTNAPDLASSLSFTTPVEQSDTALIIKLSNLKLDKTESNPIAWAGVVIGLLGLVFLLWRRSSGASTNPYLEIPAWFCIFWGVLNLSVSPIWFVLLMLAVMVRYLYLPSHSQLPISSAAPAIALMLGGVWLSPEVEAKAKTTSPLVLATETSQSIRVDEDFAMVEATVIWDAVENEKLPCLTKPAVLQHIDLPESVELLAGKSGHTELHANKAGNYTIHLSYRVPVKNHENQRQIELPLSSALASRGELIIPHKNIVVECAEAVSIANLAKPVEGQTRTELIFRPAQRVSIRWSPETRDISKEKRVFFAESYAVFQPLAGIVEGAHLIQVRPTQGVIEQLTITTPDKLTITSVDCPNLNNWRFDPEKNAVELFFQPGHTTDFDISIRSQYTSQSLPYNQSVQPLFIQQANGHTSLIALATNSEIQIGEVSHEHVSTINLEDFPATVAQLLAHPSNIPTIRRAYRWGGNDAKLSFEALAVKPDTRVTSDDRISCGEDRTLLSSQIKVEVNRAGVFQLSFDVPKNYDIESISSASLSHWNESVRMGGSRQVTLQLKQKLLGSSQFAITLSGPGLSNQSEIAIPRILFHEANRQSGTVLITPELGYRLTPTERRGVTQLDPKDYGVHETQAQLFRYLNQDARLEFNIDLVPAWIEVDQHQLVNVRSGMIENRVRAELSIENSGIREVTVQMPADSLGVRFSGESVDRFEAVENKPGRWKIYLDRKRIGKIIIDTDYQRPTPQQPDQESISGFQILGVDQSTGMLSLATQGRLELLIPSIPESLQRAESQMVAPRLRFQNSDETVAQVFRVLNPDFTIEVELIRRETASTLPAQIHSAQLLTAIADSGAALTRMRINLDPGDKRLLRLRLPPGSKFWYAFVNRQSTWPWREGEDLILQLEASPVDTKSSQVEFFYSTQLPLEGNQLNSQLVSPHVDLPMEAIEWEVYYPDSWTIDEWAGDMTQEITHERKMNLFSLSSYDDVNRESAQRQTEEAKSLLAVGNELLESGRQEDARRAFEGAYKLSSNDAAFNEDARVQLQTLREEQALVGLAQRRNVWVASNSDTPTTAHQDLDFMNYLQQDAQQLLQSNTIEDNTALREVAQELLQQQEAALVRPQALLTTVPEQGQSVRFLRSLQVNDKADLQISFSGYRRHAGHFWQNLGVFAVLLIFLSILAATNRLLTPTR